LVSDCASSSGTITTGFTEDVVVAALLREKGDREVRQVISYQEKRSKLQSKIYLHISTQRVRNLLEGFLAVAGVSVISLDPVVPHGVLGVSGLGRNMGGLLPKEGHLVGLVDAEECKKLKEVGDLHNKVVVAEVMVADAHDCSASSSNNAEDGDSSWGHPDAFDDYASPVGGDDISGGFGTVGHVVLYKYLNVRSTQEDRFYSPQTPLHEVVPFRKDT
jgi:hypothetical protein